MNNKLKTILFKSRRAVLALFMTFCIAFGGSFELNVAANEGVSGEFLLIMGGNGSNGGNGGKGGNGRDGFNAPTKGEDGGDGGLSEGSSATFRVNNDEQYISQNGELVGVEFPFEFTDVSTAPGWKDSGVPGGEPVANDGGRGGNGGSGSEGGGGSIDFNGDLFVEKLQLFGGSAANIGSDGEKGQDGDQGVGGDGGYGGSGGKGGTASITIIGNLTADSIQLLGGDSTYSDSEGITVDGGSANLWMLCSDEDYSCEDLACSILNSADIILKGGETGKGGGVELGEGDAYFEAATFFAAKGYKFRMVEGMTTADVDIGYIFDITGANDSDVILNATGRNFIDRWTDDEEGLPLFAKSSQPKQLQIELTGTAELSLEPGDKITLINNAFVLENEFTPIITSDGYFTFKIDFDKNDNSLVAEVMEIAKFNVTYNGNGNTGGNAPIDSNEYFEGEKALVLGQNTLSKTNHRFTGWNTSSSGDGTAYLPGAEFEITDTDITLYAQWEEEVQEIGDNGGGGGGGSMASSNSSVQRTPSRSGIGSSPSNTPSPSSSPSNPTNPTNPTNPSNQSDTNNNDNTNDTDRNNNTDNEPDNRNNTNNNGEDKRFVFEGAYEDLINVYLNDEPLANQIINDGAKWSLFLGENDYSLSNNSRIDIFKTRPMGEAFEGSVVVVLYQDFLASLSGGVYVVEVEFKDGSRGSMEFEIEGEPTEEQDENRTEVNPKTSASVLLSATLLSATAMAVFRKRKKY
ncbi:MAG: InlB B-repeat-containing protein [Oscillospiraceae bacterium]|nr:InlB B-repeat-containing protein [Oscillospiraceae bacterium]